MYFLNIIIYSGAAAAAAGSRIYLSDTTIGVILLIAGLIFFFALDIVFYLTGLRRGYKRPKIDFFRILGIIELIFSASFLVKAFLFK